MLVTLYFPELEQGLDELIAIRDEIAVLIADHKEVYKREGPHPTKALERLKNASAKLDQRTSRFRSKMTRLAQALGAQSKHAA